MLNNQHVTNRQAICKHAKTTEAKHKDTLIRSSTTGIYAIIFKAHNPHWFHFFSHNQASPRAARSARELQIQSNLAALSDWWKLEQSILTLIRENEQHGHVLSWHPPFGGIIRYLHSLAVFHKRTDAKFSIVITTNLTKHIPYNLRCFSPSLHYFKLWRKPFLTFRCGAYGLFSVKAQNRTIVMNEIATSVFLLLEHLCPRWPLLLTKMHL